MTDKELDELEKKYRDYLPMKSAQQILKLIAEYRKLRGEK